LNAFFVQIFEKKKFGRKESRVISDQKLFSF